ncbi:hypothetical protein AR457_36500 [Streptomyces agglomeratus]|nr:hypothetical protein AR457_36500 [Streptomyces agglomeratus]
MPFWALAWGPPAASVHSRTAKVHETMGDHRAAAEHYALAVTARPADTYARIVALDLVAGADAYQASPAWTCRCKLERWRVAAPVIHRHPRQGMQLRRHVDHTTI